MSRRRTTLGVYVLLLGAVTIFGCSEERPTASAKSSPRTELQPEEVEKLLVPLATELGKPKPGEWLYEHEEAGESLAKYRQSKPVRRSPEWKTIYICVIGDLTKEERQIVETTREYMEVLFDSPVKMGETIPLSKLPEMAKRTHPDWGGDQVLSTYVLNNILKPNRPADALASLAFTASDLWPGKNWNYVFGQASLRERTGVWSMHRFGNPAASKEAYRLCLERTLGTASHETAHILSMPHCIQYACNLNGSNSLEEADAKPLHLCPTCQAKLFWNLQVDPVKHFTRLEAFCRKHDLDDEAHWYWKATSALQAADK